MNMESSTKGGYMPFLTLTTTEINGWVMASCPEFEVSACGADRNTVMEDLQDMLRSNATLLLEEKEISPCLRQWSEEIVSHKGDLSSLFKKAS